MLLLEAPTMGEQLPSREAVAEAMQFAHITESDGDKLMDVAVAYVSEELKTEAEWRAAIDYEAVAAVEHDQWAHWTAYMLDNLSRENIIRWSLQIETPYAELTEAEKESDREWAHKAVAAALDGTDQIGDD